MGRILQLDSHRQGQGIRAGKTTHLNPHRPQLSDRDLWTRDYRDSENILYAVMKIKEILDYHLYYDDVWPYLLLSFLEAVHNTSKQGDTRGLMGTGASLKDYVLSAMSQENKRDMSMILLLTDLIEKSPTYRGTSSSP
ncbi:MAG: hypothetical protein AB9872_09660 [Solidesulfovibrio sp.]